MHVALSKMKLEIETFFHYRQNVGWASTCNSVGQTAGYFLGNVVFMALESPEFCNAYLRSVPQPEGIVTLASELILSSRNKECC